MSDADVEIALMFAANPKVTFLATVVALKESQIALDASLSRVAELEKEISEMEIELRHARCAQDHAVMYANGDRACAACGWVYG